MTLSGSGTAKSRQIWLPTNLGWHFARQVQQRERKAKENRVLARGISLSDGLWELSWVGRGRP